ncbi:ester cyclase [Haladaptatus halobius]|uniref:ester cyclase n=1 Tax=Haladaptatus halobius TaxID=2884875 RepID=UPI001D0A449F|nr:ester cyclase [Haladaptatus halobius]
MSTPEENKELVERTSFEVYTEGNVDLIDEMVSDDYVLHDPTSPEEVRGPDGLKEHVKTYRDAFPDLDATIESLIAEDDLVAVRFVTRGTHEGPLPDLPDLEPTGKEFEVTGTEFDRIEDGKLAETWLMFDTLGFMEQLGVIPSEEIIAEET